MPRCNGGRVRLAPGLPAPPLAGWPHTRPPGRAFPPHPFGPPEPRQDAAALVQPARCDRPQLGQPLLDCAERGGVHQHLPAGTQVAHDWAGGEGWRGESGGRCGGWVARRRGALPLGGVGACMAAGLGAAQTAARKPMARPAKGAMGVAACHARAGAHTFGGVRYARAAAVAGEVPGRGAHSHAQAIEQRGTRLARAARLQQLQEPAGAARGARGAGLRACGHAGRGGGPRRGVG